MRRLLTYSTSMDSQVDQHFHFVLGFGIAGSMHIPAQKKYLFPYWASKPPSIWKYMRV
jgi:hypothetical protein